MKTVVGMLLVLALCIGCQKPVAKVEPVKHNIESIAIPEEINSSLAANDLPHSVNAFVGKFFELYQKDALAPFIELCYWGELSNEDRIKYIQAARQDFWIPQTGKMRIIKSAEKIRPEPTELTAANKADGYMSGYPLTMFTDDKSDLLVPRPTHMLEIQSHINSSTSIYTYLYIGEDQGRFYICTVKQE